MAHGKEVRDKVRRLYIYDHVSLEVAALQAGVPFCTATRWKKKAKDGGDDWEKVRGATMLAGEGIEAIARQMLADYITQHKSIMETLMVEADVPTTRKVDMLASLADSFNKTVAASKRVLPETSELATAMDVVQKLAEFVRGRFPQHIHAFAELLEPFGDELARSYG